jgi:hypothetical protein
MVSVGCILSLQIVDAQVFCKGCRFDGMKIVLQNLHFFVGIGKPSRAGSLERTTSRSSAQAGFASTNRASVLAIRFDREVRE